MGFNNFFLFAVVSLLIVSCSRKQASLTVGPAAETPVYFPVPGLESNDSQRVTPSPSPSASATPSPSPSPSASPSPSPSGSPAPISCHARRVAPVSDTDAPAPFYISGQGNIRGAYLNDEPVPINSLIGVFPQPFGSGIYPVNVEVEDSLGNTAACSSSFVSPTVGLNVSCRSPGKTKFLLELHGPISRAQLDGISLPLPTTGNQIPYIRANAGSGSYLAQAEVLNMVSGDRGSHTVSYAVPEVLAATNEEWTPPYSANLGYQIPTSSLGVMAGLKYVACDIARKPSCWLLSLLNRNWNVQIKTSTIERIPASVGICPENTAMVGTAATNSNSTIDVLCARLTDTHGASVILVNQTSRDMTVSEGTFVQCPSGYVANGKKAELNNGEWVITLSCAKPEWKPCDL